MVAKTKVDQLGTNAAISGRCLPPLTPSFPFSCFLPTPDVSTALPLLLRPHRPFSRLLLMYGSIMFNHKLSDKRASRLHKSLQLFHGVTRSSQINMAASLTHVWYDCMGTVTGTSVFTGSQAPPQRTEEHICLSGDKHVLPGFLRTVYSWQDEQKM